MRRPLRRDAREHRTRRIPRDARDGSGDRRLRPTAHRHDQQQISWLAYPHQREDPAAAADARKLLAGLGQWVQQVYLRYQDAVHKFAGKTTAPSGGQGGCVVKTGIPGFGNEAHDANRLPVMITDIMKHILDFAAFKWEYRHTKHRPTDPPVNGVFVQTAFTF